MRPNPVKRARRVGLLLLLLTVASLLGYAAIRHFGRPGDDARAPREIWQMHVGVPYQPAALDTGDSIVVVSTAEQPRVAGLDRLGNETWTDSLPSTPMGASHSNSGLLVFSRDYVNYYQANGLTWHAQFEQPVLHAIAARDGSALVSLEIPKAHERPGESPFGELLVLFDARGRKQWEMHIPDATLMLGSSSAAGDVLTTLWLVSGEQIGSRLVAFDRKGDILHLLNGPGGVLSRMAVDPKGDLHAVSFTGSIAGVASSERWTYQVQGHVAAMAIDRSKRLIALVRPKSRNLVLDLFGGHSLLTLSLSGQRISERKVPLGSYALWIDPRDDTRLVATPDGLEAFDASGARVWQMRTASTVRAVSFFRDGYLVTLSSGQAVRYVR